MRAWKTIAVLFLLLVGCCFGQEVLQTLPVSVGKALINDLDINSNSAAQAESIREVSSAMRTFLAVEIGQIQSVCKPTKGQLANLKIAADVAVESAIEDWLAGTKKAANAQRGRPNRDVATRQHLWTSAVAGILNVDQKKLLKLHRDERLSFYKSKKGIVKAMALLDYQLLFDSFQREQLARLLGSSAKQIKFVRSSELHVSKDLEKQIVARLTETQKAKWAELATETFDSALEIHVK